MGCRPVAVVIMHKAVTDCLSVWAVLGSNLGMGKLFFVHLRNVQTRSMAYPASYAVGTGILADMKLTSAEI